mgnify:FL=1
MASIQDLAALIDKPRTMEEWLSRFNDEDRKVVEEAILTHGPGRLHPILRDLDENPFPFSAGEISDWRRRTYG